VLVVGVADDERDTPLRARVGGDDQHGDQASKQARDMPQDAP
jgi:hypothetical protein